MADILQTAFKMHFLELIVSYCDSKFYWSLYLRVQFVNKSPHGTAGDKPLHETTTTLFIDAYMRHRYHYAG